MKSFHQNYLEKLSIRRRLTDEESRHLSWMQRGLEGEQRFSKYLKDIVQGRLLVVEDLQVKFQKQTQIDAMIICDHRLYVFEIKNYAMNLRFDGQNWLMANGRTLVDNPLVQLQRSCQILENIVREFSGPVEVRPYLVFVNPDQSVKGADSDQVILSFEIKVFLEKVVQTEFNGRAANLLASHIDKYRVEDGIYNFAQYKNRQQLEKGLYCLSCHGFKLDFKNQYAGCSCGEKFPIQDLIGQAIEDYCVLYPEEQLTVSKLSDFVAGQVSKVAIRRGLNRRLVKLDDSSKPIYFLNPYYIG